MKDQMEKQFEQFQRGLTSALEGSSKMTGPVLRTNEVMVDSFNQLIKAQLEFSRSCMDIGRKQMESVTKEQDFTALFSDQGAATDYYAAVSKYGEAVRENAEKTQDRIETIGREMTDTATGFAQQGAAAAQAAVEPVKAADKAPSKTAEKAPAKAPAKAAKETPAKASSAQAAGKPASEAPEKPSDKTSGKGSQSA